MSLIDSYKNFSETLSPYTIASGGRVSRYLDYVLHTFTGSGSFVLKTSKTCDILIVAGGGGGGGTDDRCAGGGGAGGVIYLQNQVLEPGTYSVVVGRGGRGGIGGNVSGTPGQNGQNGENSSFGSLGTAIGGGGGAGPNASNGLSGGSGGGTSHSILPAGSGTAGQGFSGGVGGYAAAQANSTFAGGGGGGAGGAAQNVVTGAGYNGPTAGGIGIQISITGTPTYYAGGGGGSVNNCGGQTFVGAPGGLGGGGTGGTTNGPNNAFASIDGGNATFYGGGGGGSAGNSFFVPNCKGGDGFQGIVIVRYPIGTYQLDFLSTTTKGSLRGCFSIKKLLVTYTGPVIRIRRSIDNQIEDFYSDFFGNLTTINGIKYIDWIGQSLAYIVTWYDQSVNGNHARQNSFVSQPLFDSSNSAVNFSNPTNSFLEIASPGCIPTGDGLYTLTVQHGRLVSSLGSFFGSGSLNAGCDFNYDATGQQRYWSRWGANSDVGSQNNSLASNSIVTYRYTTAGGALASKQFWVNKVQSTTQQTGGTSGAARVQSAAINYIGQSLSASGFFANTNINYLIISASSVSNIDRVIFESPIGLEYPPSAMSSSSTTISGQPYGNGLYTTTQGTSFNSSFDAWYVFDKVTNNFGTSRWATNGGYNSLGEYTGSISTLIDGVNYLGDFVQITLPIGIKLYSYSITNVLFTTTLLVQNTPISWILAGTNDTTPSGTGNWTMIDSQTNSEWTPKNSISTKTFYPLSPLTFKTYRIVINKMGDYADPNLTFQELRLYGYYQDTFIPTATGNVQWIAKQTGNLGATDATKSVSTDSSGNIYITGYYSSLCTAFNADGTAFGTTLSNAGNTDIFLMKYDSNGTVQWVARLSGTAQDFTSSVSVDSSGNVYISGGYNSSSLTAFNANGTAFGTTLANSGAFDTYIVKYNSSGTVQWVARQANSTSSIARNNGVDSSGSVYIAGYFDSTLTAFNANGTAFGTTVTSGGSADGYVVKYDTNGNVQWITKFGGGGNPDYSSCLSVDPSGIVCLSVLYTSNPLTAFNADGTAFGTTLPFSGTVDGGVIIYNSSGFVQWVARIAGGGNEAGQDTTIDTTGNFYVTGYYNSSPLTAFNANGTAFGTNLPLSGAFDSYIVKYNSSGSVQWVARIAGTGNDFGTHIASDSLNNIYVAGWYSSNPLTAFNADGTAFGTTLPLSGTQSTYVVKYNDNGTVQWVARLGPSANTTQPTGIAVDSSGNVIINGFLISSSTLTAFNANGTSFATTITSGAGDNNGFLVKYA